MQERGKNIVIGMITGFVNGLFGSGGGSVLVPSMERFLSVKEHEAHATTIAVILPLSAVALLVYWWQSPVLWQVSIIASIGGLVGGVVGAKLMNRLSGIWLHRIFGLFMLFASVRLFL